MTSDTVAAMSFRPPTPVYLGPAAHDSGPGNKPIRRVVIHCTVSPCQEGQARKTAAYFQDPDSGGSAHYIVDPGEVVQSVLDDTIAWHAPPNQHSIGVELCDALVSLSWDRRNPERWEDENHDRMLTRAARLVARLCLAYDVPVRHLTDEALVADQRGIVGHAQVSRAFHQSGHWDPGVTFPWVDFMARVDKRVTQLRGRR